jgi:acetyl esterase/lipase
VPSDTPQPNTPAWHYAQECLRLSAIAVAEGRVIGDIAYGGERRQRMDLYLPKQTGLRDLPVLLFMHGGAWTMGTKDWCGFMAPALIDLPAIFVSVGYRLIPTVSFPDPVLDCITALRWVVGNIAQHGGSPDRSFVGGHSAGGQIAALMALRRDWRQDLPVDVIKGCFCLATTYNRRMINPAVAPEHVQAGPLTGIAPDSPLAHASDADVPFFLAWGGRDDERLERTGRQMVAALQAVKCPVEWLVLPECDHFNIHLNTGQADDPWTRKVRALMSANS